MNKNLKGIITVAIVVGIAYYAYRVYSSKKGIDYSSKESVAEHLVAIGVASNKQTLLTMELQYLANWLGAAKAGAKSFEYNGKLYNVNGGKAI
jgi:hypothetical protein